VLKKILFGLFGTYLQRKHNIKDAKIKFMEMPLHKEGLQMQELLPIKKIDIFSLVN